MPALKTVTVQADQKGIYVKLGKFIARPIKQTKFVQGSTAKAKRVTGTSRLGIGKSSKHSPGEFEEFWRID